MCCQETPFPISGADTGREACLALIRPLLRNHRERYGSPLPAPNLLQRQLRIRQVCGARHDSSPTATLQIRKELGFRTSRESARARPNLPVSAMNTQGSRFARSLASVTAPAGSPRDVKVHALAALRVAKHSHLPPANGRNPTVNRDAQTDYRFVICL